MANEISHSSDRPGISLWKLRMLMRVNNNEALSYLHHSPESGSRSVMMASGRETKGGETMEKTSEQKVTAKEAAESKQKVLKQEKPGKEAAETKGKVSKKKRTHKEEVEAFFAETYYNLINHPASRKIPTPEQAVRTMDEVPEMKRMKAKK